MAAIHEPAVYIIPDPPPCPVCRKQYPEIKMAVRLNEDWQDGEPHEVLCPNCETVVLTVWATEGD